MLIGPQIIQLTTLEHSTVFKGYIKSLAMYSYGNAEVGYLIIDRIIKKEEPGKSIPDLKTLSGKIIPLDTE